MKPKEMNIDISGDFRQCALRLANQYEPTFEMPESFANENELFEEFAKQVCQDFSEQLYPIFLDKIKDKFYQELD